MCREVHGFVCIFVVSGLDLCGCVDGSMGKCPYLEMFSNIIVLGVFIENEKNHKWKECKREIEIEKRKEIVFCFTFF